MSFFKILYNGCGKQVILFPNCQEAKSGKDGLFFFLTM